MRFVPIAPISLQLEILRTHNFALAHMLTNSKYRENMRILGGLTFLILDNGAYEIGTLSIQTLLDLALDVKASELILPDVLHDSQATLKATGKALDYLFLFGKEFTETKRMMLVPQGTDLIDWIACAELLITDYKVRFGNKPFTIGVPKVTAKFLGGRRNLLSKFLVEAQMIHQFDIHLLGVAEDIHQIKQLAQAHGKHIRTIDSARPFIWAHANRYLSVIHEDTDYPGRPADYFNLDFSYTQKLLTLNNIFTYERILQDATNLE